MAPPTLELTIMAAEDLKNVATFGKMDVYGVAWIDPYMKQTTRVLHKSGENPVWNDSVTIGNLENAIQHYPNAFLTVQIRSEAAMGDKVVGTARLPLQEILRISPGEDGEPALVILPLQRPSGRTQGIVRLSMRTTGDLIRAGTSARQPVIYGMDKSEEDQDTVIGIPVPSAPYYDPGTTSTGYPSLSSIEGRGVGGNEIVPSAYPPQFQGYPGYYQGDTGVYPTRPAYPYYPPPYYPYVQPPRPQARNNGNLLLGLLGGALGGLLLGDIFS